MAWRKEPVDLEYTDDELLDRIAPDYEPPSYPYGCQVSLAEPDLERAAGEKGRPGESLCFEAWAEVTSVYHGENHCRVELQITELAGEDGDFAEIRKMPQGAEADETWRRFGCLSLGDAELEKMGLEADCDLGDMIHLIGEARLDSVSRTESGGAVAGLQITKLAFEDESEESPEG